MTSILTAAQREKLAKAIIHKPPYCSGTLPVPDGELILFYGKDEDARRLDFGGASEGALQHLSQTCEAATFGLNKEDILDETYRKAGKLDSPHFAVKLDLDSSGLLEIVRTKLLEGRKAQGSIHAELYKLNVYGEGSFFKPHKDTPRSTNMFGSLVIVYPTAHEGGALTMSHEGESWTFDSGKMLAGHSEARIGYVAFFSDVDHEVTLVKSGYRVTITYNLYFVDPPVYMSLSPSVSSTGEEFRSAFVALLADPTFLPTGGHLGFGLRHEYPLQEKPEGTDVLQYMKKYLKGSDADILLVCEELSLEVELNIVFEDYGDTVILPKAPEVEGIYLEENLCDYLRRECEAKLIGPPVDGTSDTVERSSHEGQVDVALQWVTDLTQLNVQKSNYTAYGNEADLAHAYGYIALIVEVGKLGDRATRATLSV
ncbi:hypothetical protein EW026_g4903 [Hermanssonia centrifuga]|uniref:Fe2OG dioxygenase domain-containing protein n=1 Tax=Hermanssonia centrifuga TaxID=98765 RepID=A0A4V3XA74_9APHY|nr:hypothetical protein EW026_g4903 [Hermanssonia centrifuga]